MVVLTSLLLLPVSLLLSLSTAEDSYDYIVVGGGTSGVTIAARLAEQNHNVALVEAGTRYETTWPFAAIPAADVLPVGSDPKSNFPADWKFVTTPQAGANDREIHFARGKCLGGSSAFNFMIYQRPTKQSLQKWASDVNNDDYLYDNILPYYQKTTKFTPPDASQRADNASAKYEASSFTDNGGPLQISYADYAMPFSSWMKRGMDAIGIKEANDFNNGELMGYQYCSSTIDPAKEHRATSESAFLASEPPSNLKVLDNTLAKRVLFNSKKAATGVEIKDGFGITKNITASKEVVVSAGAFQSPQLLMVSGIGPADTLKEHNIPVLSDLAGVGQNMWDHPFFGPTYRVNTQTFTKVANDILYLGMKFLDLEVVHKGPLANPVSDFLAWEKIPDDLRSSFSDETKKQLSQFPDDWPEAEYISGAGYIGNFSNLLTTQPKDGYQYASMLGVLITPTSRGNVTLRSADTSDLPIINPNWLSTESDQQVAVAMFKRMRQAFQSDAMAPTVIGKEYNPGLDAESDENILQYIKNTVMTLWHPAGTCKMGTSDDSDAVVDSEAKVFGVSGLRVVDASAVPFLPPGHPQSTCYMLAEKIAASMLGSQ